ncbi:MAG: uracil-DNA glycosylase [Woeseiaceae bacterium]|nr:uracil-DNA glycosylase [Woeseiaceae bacterium]
MVHPEQQRRAYLDALGIDVWVPRDEPEPEAAAVEERDEAAAPVASEGLAWPALRDAVSGCTRCALHETRTQTVFGVGNENADWMIIGEAPGAEEDRRGEPFVGRAGKLLDEMLRAVGQGREKVFIANILKCRPPNNRDPKPEESSQCRGYLERQIELVQPRIILAVGRIAAQLLLDTDTPVGRLRGKAHQLGTTPLVVTYHPAYLLRSPSQKRKSWDDLCLARRVAAEVAE